MSRVYRFFDAILGLGIVASLAVAVSFVVVFDRSSWTTRTVLWFGVAPLLFGMGLAAAFKLRREVRANLAMVLLFAGITLYGVEIYLALDPGEDAASFPPNGDQRTPIEVIRDLRAQGEAAYPFIGRRYETETTVEGQQVVPLAGIPHVLTVVCNETGEFFTYRSDRFGFNNPDGVWEEDAIELALLGDSFTQGACVPNGGNFASLIRARHPLTLNLGYSDQGPLSQLATLREYAARVEPDHVLWFFYETNDVTHDLPAELRSTVLHSYLTSAKFRQGLAAKREAIGASLAAEFDRGLRRLEDRPEGQAGGTSVVTKLVDAVKLTNLRTRLGLTVRSDQGAAIAGAANPPDERLWGSFEATLLRAKATVGEWDGELHFVYLPGIDSFLGRDGTGFHDRVLELVGRVGLPVVDLHPVFSGHRDPMSLFPPIIEEGHDEGGRRVIRDRHYSERGHGVVAREVVEYLVGLPGA